MTDQHGGRHRARTTAPATPGRRRQSRAVYVRRRVVAAAVGVALVVAVGAGARAVLRDLVGDDASAAAAPATSSTSAPTSQTSTPTRSSSSSTSSSTPPDPRAFYAALTPQVPAPTPSPRSGQGGTGPSGVTVPVQIQRLSGNNMSPKSIVASPSLGILFAQNMMYHHTMSVFRSDGALLKTIPDSVTLSDFGISGHPGTSRGAPVEMAFTPDGKHAWVSNYSMYGSGFGPEGSDQCRAGDGTDTSYVYRVDTHTFEIDKVVPVGAVPKYVAVTPDGSKVLVTNWCSWDLSVIDTATNTQVRRIPLGGAYPRGIVVSPDSTTAYVALMGSGRIAAVDLATRRVSTLARPGSGPRHLVISPDGKDIYVTNNGSGTVAKIERSTGKILGTVRTGDQPRSMAISSDGQAVYVVNYRSSTMTKVRTSDLKVLSTKPTDGLPIGITYEPHLKRVWVACYNGTVLVFDDSRRPVT